MPAVKAILLVTWIASSGIAADQVDYPTAQACDAARKAVLDAATPYARTVTVIAVCTLASDKG